MEIQNILYGENCSCMVDTLSDSHTKTVLSGVFVPLKRVVSLRNMHRIEFEYLIF